MWSFISRIKDYPQEFILPQRKIANTKPNNQQGTWKPTESNEKNESVKKGSLTNIHLKLESCLKPKQEICKQEPQEEEQIYENGPIINSQPVQVVSEPEAIYGNDSVIEEIPLLPPRKPLENTDTTGSRKISPTTHIYPNEQFFKSTASSESSNTFIRPTNITPQTLFSKTAYSPQTVHSPQTSNSPQKTYSPQTTYPQTSFTSQATSPSPFLPPNGSNSDMVSKYVDCDTDGYLLPTEVFASQEEENIYEPEPMTKRNFEKPVTNRTNRPPPILHRPLPEVPMKKVIEIIQEQKTQEALRKALLDRKHSLDKKELRKSPLLFENKTPEKPIVPSFPSHSRDIESEDITHSGIESQKLYLKSKQ